LRPEARRAVAAVTGWSRRRAALRAGGGAFAALLLAACAGLPPGTPAPPLPAYVDTPFTAAGRLSARHDSDAIAVHFTWSHDPPHDALAVTTPLGQTVAELSGDTSARRVAVTTADGRRREAADWPALTEQALGFPLPVADLAAWIRGAPHPGAAATFEADGEGRVALLRQEGWEIIYDYADAAARMPQRLRIAYPGFEIRVVVDQWR
jgi:outer membrane lipoprotein LolB